MRGQFEWTISAANEEWTNGVEGFKRCHRLLEPKLTPARKRTLTVNFSTPNAPVLLFFAISQKKLA
jgi:hypothetical protein